MASTEIIPSELSEQTKEIVKGTGPVLEEHGLAITERLYHRLFREHPELRSMFGGAGPGQPERLAAAVLAYAQNIDNLDALTPVVQQIAAKHVEAGVLAEHYEIVGATLLTAMVEVLGELDLSVVDAWAEAYDYLADIFISVEAELSAGGSS